MDEPQSAGPRTLFVLKTIRPESPFVVAEIADTLDPVRWSEVLASHPDVVVRPENEMGGVYETPLRQWRRIMRPGRTERRARAAGSITGVAVLSAAERRRFDEDAARVAELRRSGQLTPREREVMELLDIGLTAHETALVLEVNPRAVAHHLENVLELLGAPTRAEALTRFRAWEPAQQAR